jgi:hypothetical protein
MQYHTGGHFAGCAISVVKTNDLQNAPSNYVLSTSVNLTEQIRAHVINARLLVIKHVDDVRYLSYVVHGSSQKNSSR